MHRGERVAELVRRHRDRVLARLQHHTETLRLRAQLLRVAALPIAVTHQVGDGAGDVRETLDERELLLREHAVARKRDEAAPLPCGHDDRGPGVELRENRARPVRAAAHQQRRGATATSELDRGVVRKIAGHHHAVGETDDRGAARDRGGRDGERCERAGLRRLARGLGQRIQRVRRRVAEPFRVVRALARRHERRDVEDQVSRTGLDLGRVGDGGRQDDGHEARLARGQALDEAGSAGERFLERHLVGADPHVDRAEREDLRAQRVEERLRALGLGERPEGVAVAAHPLAVRGRAHRAVDELGADEADRDERLDHPERRDRRLAGPEAQGEVVGEDRRRRGAEDAEGPPPERRVRDGEAVQDPGGRVQWEREDDRGRRDDVERAPDQGTGHRQPPHPPVAEDDRPGEVDRDGRRGERGRALSRQQDEGGGKRGGGEPEAQRCPLGVERENRLPTHARVTHRQARRVRDKVPTKRSFGRVP